MLTVVCSHDAGTTRQEILDRLADQRAPQDALLVLPSYRWADKVRKEIVTRAGIVCGARIVAWDSFRELPLNSLPTFLVRGAERKAILRAMLLATLGRFSHLTMQDPVNGGPYVSAGLLSRLSDVVARIAERPKSDRSKPVTDIEQETLKLAEDYEKRLSAADAMSFDAALRSSWRDFSATQFAQKCPGVRRVVFDGFDVFDDVLLNAVHRLGACTDQCVVILDHDPAAEPPPFPHIAEAFARLHQLADRATVRGPAGEGVTMSLADVTLIAAPTRAGEVRAIARFLRTELDAAERAQREFKFDDYAVCFPSLERYAPLIRETFRDYDIPYVLTTGIDLEGEPVWRLVELLAAAVASGLDMDAVARLVASPLLRRGEGNAFVVNLEALNRARAEIGAGRLRQEFLPALRGYLGRLRSAVERARPGEGPNEGEDPGAKYAGDLRDFQALEHALSDLLATLEPVGPRAITAWPDTLFSLLDRLTADCELARPSGLSAHQMHRFARSRERLERAALRLAACAPLLGSAPSKDQNVTLLEFVSLLEIFVRGEKIPGQLGLAGGFSVMGRLEARGISPRVLIVGGLVEGEFPVKEQLPPAAFDNLAPIARSEDQSLSQQRYLFEQFLLAAQERVILLRPLADGEEELLCSHFVENLIDAGRVKEQEFNKRTAAEENSPRSSSEAFIDLGRLAAGGGAEVGIPRDDDAVLTPDERATLQNCAWNLAAEAERTRTDALGVFDGFLRDPSVIAAVAERADGQIYSPSQLDVLVQCPFRYFVERLLGLEEPDQEDEEISALVLGQITHAVLFRFYTRWTASGRSLIVASVRPEAAEMLADAVEEELDRAPLSEFAREWTRRRLLGFGGRDVFLGDDAASAPLRGHVGILGAYVANEIRRASESPDLLPPRYFEIGFGIRPRSAAAEQQDNLSEREPVTLRMGDENVRLRGKADRIDANRDYFAIVDYKTGTAPTINDQLGGYRVQLPVYLLAFEHILKQRGTPLASAGGVFYELKHKEAKITGQFFRAELKALEAIGSRQKGLSAGQFDAALATVRTRVADGISRLRRGYLHTTLAHETMACKYCSSALVCRKDLARTVPLVHVIAPDPVAVVDEESD